MNRKRKYECKQSTFLDFQAAGHEQAETMRQKANRTTGEFFCKQNLQCLG